MGHDYTHCADWDARRCPKGFFRAKPERDLRERWAELWYLPISYAHLKGTEECELTRGPGAQAGAADPQHN